MKQSAAGKEYQRQVDLINAELDKEDEELEAALGKEIDTIIRLRFICVCVCVGWIYILFFSQ